MNLNLVRIAVLALSPVLAASSFGALTSYSQNFEGLNMSSTSALADDGWKVFGNVFDSGGNYLYNYGPFPAPNTGAAFCSIATGEGGAAQGLQYLNTFSDYNNGDHANNRLIEANTFQEQVVAAGDIGKTFEFKFDYKASSTAGPSGQTVARAFIKVLNPGAGFALVSFPTLVTTSASTTAWATGSLNVTIEQGWTNHILQFGFMNTATAYQPSGVFYDNINFSQPIPEPATMSVFGAALVGLVARRRRK